MASSQLSNFPPPCGPPPRNELMAFFQGYFDESGKYQDQTVVSFCGFVDSDWSEFMGHWQHLLRKNNLRALHFSKSNLRAKDAQLKIYQSFIQAIKQHVERGFAIAVDVTAYDALHPDLKPEKKHEDPHYMAFYTVLRDVIKYASILPDPSVAVICDDEPSKACECYKMFDRMRQNVKQPENRKVMKSIAFADDEFYPQLQAADLFSWISRAESMYRFQGINYSLRDLHREFNIDAPTIYKTVFTTGFWDKDVLKELEKGVRDGSLRAGTHKKSRTTLNPI